MRARNLALTGAHRLAILAYVIVALFPLFWLLKESVTPNDLLYSEGVRMWPSRTTWEHYEFVIAHSAFPTFFKNSLIVAGSTAIVVTIVASLSGYALSRFSFRAKYWIVALMLITQMFPLVMLVAPIFKMLSPLGLTNSLTGLVIVYSAFNVPFATFLMQSFFDGIPKDLEEAAMIDGATQFVAFREIILPLTLPGIMVGAFLTFVLCIGDYITPQILGGNNELVLPQVIMLQLGRRADFPMAAALSIVLMVVVTIAYLACARWLKMERT